MSKRPTKVPLWGYDATAGQLVEPPTGLAKQGWNVEQRPPAPYMNAWQNQVGAWVNFLRGPQLSNWTRRTWSASPTTFDIGEGPIVAAADLVTADTSAARLRFAITGMSSAPAGTMRVSRRGVEWLERFNVPNHGGVHRGCAFGRGLWFVWEDNGTTDGHVYTTPPDDGTSTSAITADANAWDTPTMPASTKGVVALACNATHVCAITVDKLIHSTDGVTWSNYTVAALARTGDGRDVAWTGAKWVAITDDSEVLTAAAPSDTWTRVTVLDLSATAWRLTAGEGGTIVAWRETTGTALPLFISTDHGATWVEKAVPAKLVKIRALRYADGVFLAATEEAPYLWQSNDCIRWTQLPLPLPEGTHTLHDVVYAGGTWTAIGNGWTFQAAPAADLAPGSWTPETAAPALADAGYLRGYRVDETAPTDGQVLVWDAGAEAWVPTTLPAFRAEVGLTGAHTIDSGEGGPWYTVGSWRYVASEWPSCTFALRCEGTVTTDGLAGQVRLIRADTLASAGSTIELDTVPPSNGSAALTLVDGVIYLLQQRFNIGLAGDSFTLLGARIHIVRS